MDRYDPIIITNSKPDIDMHIICNCKHAKTLSDCIKTCGRAALCQNTEVAEDILRSYKHHFP